MAMLIPEGARFDHARGRQGFLDDITPCSWSPDGPADVAFTDGRMTVRWKLDRNGLRPCYISSLTAAW